MTPTYSGGRRAFKSWQNREAVKAALQMGKRVVLCTKDGWFPVVGVVDDPNTRKRQT